jgi:hypothetical protein
MIRVEIRYRQRITKDARRFLECDSVLPAIFVWLCPDPTQNSQSHLTAPLLKGAISSRLAMTFRVGTPYMRGHAMYPTS